MSDIFGAVASSAIAGASVGAFGPLIGDVATGMAIIGGNLRNIGGIYPHVTIEEVHRDEMLITQHPVEQGAPVTDHAFMQPVTVEIRCGFSNSRVGSEGFVQMAYRSLRELMSSAQPFDIVTGKRFYQNMLMRSLLVRTDAASEYALMVVALCQEIIITSSATASPSAASPSAAASTTTPSSGFQSIAPTTTADGSFQTQGGASIAPAGSMSVSPTATQWSNAPYSAGTQMAAPTSNAGALSAAAALPVHL